MIDALISGKLIRDPVLKTGSSGKPYCNFMLSVSADDERVIVSGMAFGGVAERIGKLNKGDALSVTGSLKPSEWTDKTTGETKHGLNVTVSAALSAYDVKKRRGSTVNEKQDRGMQHQQDNSPLFYNDPIPL
jgi:single-stranded DNA-binding protein